MSSNPVDDAFSGVATRLGARLRHHERLTGGVSARVEALELEFEGGEVRRVVFRQPGAAEWNKAAADTTRHEYELLEWLHSRGLPVPRALLQDVSCEVWPHPYFVMDYVDGTREVADARAAVNTMAELLAAVHGLPLDGVPSLPEREDPIASVQEFLPEEHEALRARLLHEPPKLTPRRAMLHGDYWPGNLLWRGSQLVALLDWEGAALGDPLSDLACCRLELRYKHGSELSEAFTTRYASVTRCELDELPVWDAYVSAAALASMAQWGLPPSLEAHMRHEAEIVLREAAGVLLGRGSSR